MLIKTLAALLGVFTLSAFAADEDARIRAEGEKRGKPPEGWPRMEWPVLKEVLFGHYGPTEKEKSFVMEALPREGQVMPKKKRKLLVFYRCQYPHVSIATGTLAFDEMGRASGAYEAVLSDDPAIFTKEGLKSFDAVLLNNTTSWDKTLGETGRQALVDYVKEGGGLVGIHAASDACKGFREGAEMIGGVFRCHPWLPKTDWAFKLEQPQHPLNTAFQGKGFWFRDEIYLYRGYSFSPERSSVLVSLDMSQEKNITSDKLHKKDRELIDPAKQYPAAWLHEFGEGRVFYSNFGHNPMTYWDPVMLKHYLGGIQYALGDLEAEAVPTAELEEIDCACAPGK